ncbi:KH domain-containing, RNA-binding, signal transduction-associated protein 2 isoform X5 [Astyanax mexicanus]|uniref:KH domain-containing, RNA-binding, signal transduction-associated protein 2 isoform X5 n=1 Tax=Astyanax mexicanus TaxID=7994 RepID=UPI0020CB5988|nr:KH domain-containing, RNA-binding, signal transduction-associated protein 2 isoform X5 [Astyanax mexicanus]
MDQDKYLPELMAEKETLDTTFVHAMRLLAEEIEKYEGDELRKDGEVKKYLDVISNKNIKLSERVLIPVQQYPKFNFVGKLLGPRGNSMKRLQEETGAKMSILGKGSMRDKGKDYNDEIRQEQLRELSYLNGSDDPSRARSVRGRGIRITSTATTRGRGGTVPPPPPGRGAAAARGTAGTRTTVPTTMLSRGVTASRTRGTPGTPGYRAPLLQATHENYDDYAYDDGYDGEYDDQSYEGYDDNYNNQSKSVSEYYEYGHGTNDDNNYAEEEWTQPRPSLKAPTARLTRGGYREHPYGVSA